MTLHQIITAFVHTLIKPAPRFEHDPHDMSSPQEWTSADIYNHTVQMMKEDQKK